MAYEDFIADLADGMADLLHELGRSVQYRRLSEDPVEIRGVWTEDEAEVPAGAQATLWTTAGELAAHGVTEPRKTDTVRSGQRLFRVADTHREGDPDSPAFAYTLHLKYVQTLPE